MDGNEDEDEEIYRVKNPQTPSSDTSEDLKEPTIYIYIYIKQLSELMAMTVIQI